MPVDEVDWDEVFGKAEEPIEDVSLDDFKDPYPKRRRDLVCGDCGAKMELRTSKKYRTPFYGCTRWPECDGKHGAHRDGSPKGIPANKKTRKARIGAHRIFDEIWKTKLVKSRGAAYAWMRQAMGLSHSEAHIGNFNEKQCEDLIRLVKEAFPTLRTRYDVIDTLELEDDAFEA